ncbi:hypothetical protein HBI55_079510 [Parastagonospora nodorum]|nr:hypothetical protein HBI06_146030 [Parastagonospora nodorum]KAH4232289.1 hypothetical protein HBI05_176600 [Parastagonospora nodorum]KAH6498059.1 hypothetical protein HBI55_079510 [Parastagonospora nodorum]
MDLPKKRKDAGIEARLSRVEKMLHQLLQNQKADARHTPAFLPNDTPQIKSPADPGFGSDEAALTPASTLQSPEIPLFNSYTGLARKLVEFWPSQADLLNIYALPISFSTHSHINLCIPSATMSSRETITTTQILQLPPPGCHPVLIARKLLFLGSLLQGTISAPQLSMSLRDRFKMIMSGAIDAAIRLVTTDDALTASVEGVECIMGEAMIHNYIGNLHRAWLAVRRASGVAQTIGLHKGHKSSTYITLGPKTRAEFDPDVLCFRIIEMDRYLSVTLGLAQSSLETRALEPDTLAQCHPIDRMARLQCNIAGRIMKYDPLSRPRKTPEFLTEMEALLQQAAHEMSPQWWTIPDLLSGQEHTTGNPLQEISRINYQFSHYHLVMRLHLPYMLGTSQHAQSKIAAANAARETLSRYMIFRRWSSGHFYCRGVDYLAFIALAVLCLAHIDASSSTVQDDLLNSDIVKILAQSHLSDRGIMERTLDILKGMGSDKTASKLASIMQHILDVEAAAVSGVGYNAVAKHQDGQTEYSGRLEQDNATLKLNIPYFGTITLLRKMASLATGTLPEQPQTMQWDYDWLQQPDISQRNAHTCDINARLTGSPLPTGDFGSTDDCTLQSINDSLFGSLFGCIEGQEAFLSLESLSAQDIDTSSRT